jgi:hypothetical protein
LEGDVGQGKVSFMTSDTFEKGEDEPVGRGTGTVEDYQSSRFVNASVQEVVSLTTRRKPTPNPRNNSSTFSSWSIDDESELGRCLE